jgi:tetratricopeptide (TPR) repeat protein
MSVRLCMLARDEAEQMVGVASACEGLYDDWIVLMDDRTVDETETAAHELLAGSGSVVRFRFEDFAQARNALFAAARPGAEWLLLADPDSPPTGTLPGLVHSWYECAWREGFQEWKLPILVRAELDCRYEHPAHELLVVPNGEPAGFADQLRVHVQPKELSPLREEWIATLLKPTAATDSRDAFYYARTLDRLGRQGEAIEAYLRCAQLPQWDEQIYICLLSAGRLMRGIDADLADALLVRAHEFRPARAEALHELANLANTRGDHARAAAYCAKALQLPRSDDRLFVNRWSEKDGILVEMGRAVNAMQSAAPPPTLEAP